MARNPVRWSATALIAVLAAAALPAGAAAQQDLSVYGYLATRYEKVWDVPVLNGTVTDTETAPGEYTIPAFHLMLSQNLGNKFRIFANLAGPDAETLEVRNLWGEIAVDQLFNIRFGKTYRRFGLYNEILDAVPTYYGIEAPEMFDGDHLLISRTSTLMIHGAKNVGPGTFSYALTNDNGEGDLLEDAFPVGFDARYTWGYGAYTVGFSGYTSGGPATSDRAVGEGSPNSGVLPWMAESEFDIFGGFAQVMKGPLTLQFEYQQASHQAVRDPSSVLQVIANAGVNSAQLARFLIDPAGSQVDPANVRTEANFDIRTWYFRAGYSIETDRGEFAPYVQWDWYSNPETIASKTWGGDAEAGEADDGEFTKPTIGIIYRPVPTLAIKLDGSAHYYRFNGEDVNYPEIRIDVSYMFGF
jgi:hypothetical protein